jgi:acetyl-CoA carboxylase biotin carboxyl carrier protein
LGEVFGAEAVTDVSLSTAPDPYHDDMSHTVVAELVAAVMKVEVDVGDRVAADDPVVILESMKMEIPVLAEVPGTVTEVVVASGDVVNDGDPLVVIRT